MADQYGNGESELERDEQEHGPDYDDPDPLAEDYPGQRITGPECRPDCDKELEHKFIPGTGEYPDYLYCQECGASETEHRL